MKEKLKDAYYIETSFLRYKIASTKDIRYLQTRKINLKTCKIKLKTFY